MTIIGGAGTGKRFIIHSILNFVRKKIRYNEVVHVATPTGTAAFNVQSETIHRVGGIAWQNPNKEMSDTTRERLLENLQKTMVLLLDEISMISQQLLGSLEQNVGKMAHEVTNVSQGWGGAFQLW
jgi:ABC-type dipeptide/oligopeptide/nickel transport system ATPase component